jgi:dihydropteroate synthase
MVKLVGILNVTPDSFSDGGKFYDPASAIAQADKLFSDGASLVDIGAESTRPKAKALTADEEWQRLEPILKVLIPKYPSKISLDSYHPETQDKAFAIGPVIINDVTGMTNPEMVSTVAKLKPPMVIISHLPDMALQEAHQLEPVTTIKQVREDLLAKAKLLEEAGISRDQIILDPGIGFGKTRELNEQLLKFAEQVPLYSVMIGYSRKRFLGEDRMSLAPNLKAGRIAIAHHAKYLRVHDVAGQAKLLK